MKVNDVAVGGLRHLFLDEACSFIQVGWLLGLEVVEFLGVFLG